jgi:hypothetical protein
MNIATSKLGAVALVAPALLIAVLAFLVLSRAWSGLLSAPAGPSRSVPLLGDDVYARVFANTFVIAIVVTVVALLIAFLSPSRSLGFRARGGHRLRPSCCRCGSACSCGPSWMLSWSATARSIASWSRAGSAISHRLCLQPHRGVDR